MASLPSCLFAFALLFSLQNASGRASVQLEEARREYSELKAKHTIDHPLAIEALLRLAGLELNAEELADADGHFQEAFEVLRKDPSADYEKKSQVLAGLLNAKRALAEKYMEQEAAYAVAEWIFQQGLEYSQKLPGGNQLLEFAQLKSSYARLLFWTGRFDMATRNLQDALSLFEAHQERHLIAQALGGLGQIYKARRMHQQAEDAFGHSLDLFNRTLSLETHCRPTEALEVAQCFLNWGDYSRARGILEKSLDTCRQQNSPNGELRPLRTALASIYQRTGLLEKAEGLYLSMLTAPAKTDQDRLLAAEVERLLGGTYEEMGLYQEAEAHLRRGREIVEQLKGSSSRELIPILRQLASVNKAKGDFQEALRYLAPLEAGALRESASIEYSLALGELGGLYGIRREWEKAAQRLEKAIDLVVKVNSKDPAMVLHLSSLASIHLEQGRVELAQLLFEQAVKLGQDVVGEESIFLATAVQGLGETLRIGGQLKEAEKWLAKSLSTRERFLGNDHPSVALSLSSLSMLRRAQGQAEGAIQLQTQANEIGENQAHLMLAFGSDREKRAYMATLEDFLYITLTIHICDAPENPDALHAALNSVLRWKGRVIETLVDWLASMRRSESVAKAAVLDALLQKLSQQAHLIRHGWSSKDPENYRLQMTRLQEEIELLENKSGPVGTARSVPVVWQAVRDAVPEGAALVEMVRFRVVDPHARSLQTRWAGDRYAAYVLLRGHEPFWADLGEAEQINELVLQFRRSLSNRLLPYRPIGEQLYRKLIKPISDCLRGTKLLLLSPDSDLHLVPFAALTDETGSFLIERFAIDYLNSGRDLLRTSLQEPRQGPVVVAAPAYGKERSRSPGRMGEMPSNFAPLPGLLEEARSISEILPQAVLLTGDAALESKLKQLQGPSILHIASTGFFLNDPTPFPSVGFMHMPGASSADEFYPYRTNRLENPLWRSGIALAGANSSDENASEDGILLASEAYGLDLMGTQLVVLSACDTGYGRAANGRGVDGLRRSFQIAGASTLLMSLWRIDDVPTADLMADYYRGLLAGQGKVEALQKAQQKRIRDKQLRDPANWAGFIVSGDWRPLTSGNHFGTRSER